MAVPPEIRPPRLRKRKLARDVINSNGLYDFTFLETDNRAKATLERAHAAIRTLGSNKRFLLVYYGSDGGGGWQPLDRPLRTITTLDRFAYVRPSKHGHQMRMLQVEELKRAMGFPERFRLSVGTRRDKIKLLGNAVCPEVMRVIVRTLITNDCVQR
jgi:DNA (cytosine-5)-methyltransferase 1